MSRGDRASDNPQPNQIDTVLMAQPTEEAILDEFQITVVDDEKVIRMLKRMKPKTSSGPDNIPGFLIKELATYLAPNLTLLYNTSIAVYC